MGKSDIIKRGSRIREVGDFWNNKGLLPGMVMEEAAELIQAVNKHERKRTDESKQNVVDEIGDLLIILSAYRYIYGVDDDAVDARIDYKLGLDKED